LEEVMRLAHCAAGLSLILVTACAGGGQNPSVSVAATPPIAPAGAPPSSATAACAGIDSQQGGGVAYLNCVERHE
jgi:hypothetical protein